MSDLINSDYHSNLICNKYYITHTCDINSKAILLVPISMSLCIGRKLLLDQSIE